MLGSAFFIFYFFPNPLHPLNNASSWNGFLDWCGREIAPLLRSMNEPPEMLTLAKFLGRFLAYETGHLRPGRDSGTFR